ncbi:MAG TPA: autotransporter outer membrane beta-barrel domain-containing protein [Cyclobacteriaceae bacterium]|jgi:outer membrane protein|nr:autotransporter outer membrane beta-barrel domain-containing protein [Cyclobacteriaceae bacterium]
MKKIALVTVFALVISTSFAQTQQGRMMVGGSLGFSGHTDKTKNNNTTVTTDKYTTFSLAPQFGYFVIDNLAVGAGLDLSAESHKMLYNDSKSVTTTLQFEPFVRYYLPMKIFFHGSFGVGSSKVKTTDNNVTTTSNGGVTSGSIAAGYAWFLNSNVAIEPMVGYSSTRTNPSGNLKYLESGPFIKVGFQIYLGK